MIRINLKKIKNMGSKVLILLAALFIIIALFKLFLYYESQRKLISEFKNTKIKETLIINNKKVNMNKPYKIKGDTVYIPIIELCKNFGAKTSYEFKSNGGIDFKYQNSLYHFKRGSNEVRFANDNYILTMDGEVVFMENTLYVPLDFIYKVLDINVQQANNGVVYMDNYPNKFNYDWTKENKYIAKRMGGVDGYANTNSKEAMEESYKRGIRVLQGDLTMTSDGKLVLCTDFTKESLANLSLPLTWQNEIPSEKEFLSKKIKNKYTTMSFNDVAEFMKNHKDVYFVVGLNNKSIKDVEKDYKEILKVSRKVDNNILKRIIPQIYYDQMYRPIMNMYDFKSAIYVVNKDEKKSMDKIIDFSFGHGIKIISLEEDKLSKDTIRKLTDRSMGIYMYGFNDLQKVSEFDPSYIFGVFSDYLPKEIIKRDEDGKVIVEKNREEDNKTKSDKKIDANNIENGASSEENSSANSINNGNSSEQGKDSQVGDEGLESVN